MQIPEFKKYLLPMAMLILFVSNDNKKKKINKMENRAKTFKYVISCVMTTYIIHHYPFA